MGEQFFCLGSCGKLRNVCKQRKVKSIQFFKQIGLILTANNQICSGTIASWDAPLDMVATKDWLAANISRN